MKACNIELTAKQSHYGVDGTGRDSYINFNNGGTYRGFIQEGRGKFEVGSFPSQRQFRQRSVHVEGKPLHYIGDGSGRDCYIISDEGGISRPGERFNYLKYLRAPVQRNQPAKDDFLARTNSTWRKRSTTSSFNSSKQRNLDSRLSTPKQYDDPYKLLRSTFSCSMRSSSRTK